MTKRRVLRAAAYVFVAIALLACGGDGFDSVRNLRSTNEAIVCLGDRLTEGIGANGGEDYPAVLSRELAFPVRCSTVAGAATPRRWRWRGYRKSSRAIRGW